MNRFTLSLHIAFLCLHSALVVEAQSPTWSKDIAPILYKNCTGCHHPGGLAPNSLLTYNEAYNYRFMIRHYVDNNIMPPWPPDAKYSRFAHERVISDEDKNRIAAWVTSAAPEGNAADAPAMPVYGPEKTKLSSIDYSAKMPDYVVNTAGDLYRCFVINTNFSSDKFASEIEVIPGNRGIVHHVLVYEDTTQLILQKDNQDPGPGYTSFFGTGSNDSKLVGEWVPGTEPIRFPPGMGLRLRKNTRLVLQVHYPKGTYLQTDSTRVNIKFTDPSGFSVFREVFLVAPLSEGNLVNGPLVIPPDAVKTFTATSTATIAGGLPFNAFTALSVAPHMHLIGDKIKVFALESGTSDTIPLINIPEWDFKWQGIYNFRKPVRIAEGSTLVAVSAYDNTSGNPENPSSPPKLVTQGEATTDEMMLVFFAFTYYLPGDENIVIDNSPLVSLKELRGGRQEFTLHEITPNPVRLHAMLNYFSPMSEESKIKIYSLEGKLMCEMNSEIRRGYGKLQLPLAGFSAGQYFVQIHTSGGIKTKSFIVYE